MRIRSYSNNSGSSWWRLDSIARHVNANTNHEWLTFKASEWNGDALDGDIVVFQMITNPEAVKEAQASGAKVVYEMDDLITERTNRPEITNPATFVSMTKEAIKLADLVTVTTEELAIYARKLNPNVVILPNYIDTEWWGEALNIKRRGKTRIGWAGSTSHASDLKFIAPVIKRVLEDFPDTEFIYCGAGGVSSGSVSTELLYGKDLFADIPTNRREYHLGVNTELWGLKSKTLHFDIAIAPLIKDQFNDCKSNIKWQEYSLNGWAGIYSDEPPYKNITHALKASDPESFYQQIKYLIEHPKERAKMAALAKQDVLDNWTLDKHYNEWLKAYKKCLNQ